jgi:hypothetical protein
LKCQKNVIVVGKFYLGQAEEDSSDRLLPVHETLKRSIFGQGVRMIRSCDVVLCLRTYMSLVDSDVSVVRSEQRH